VLPGPAVTRNGLNSNIVPTPCIGTKLAMKAEIRKILRVPGVGAGPAMMFADTFQFGSEVMPARWTGGLSVPLVMKVIMAESKTKSPWNPT